MNVVSRAANLDGNAAEAVYHPPDVTEDSWKILVAEVHACGFYVEDEVDIDFY